MGLFLLGLFICIGFCLSVLGCVLVGCFFAVGGGGEGCACLCGILLVWGFFARFILFLFGLAESSYQ